MCMRNKIIASIFIVAIIGCLVIVLPERLKANTGSQEIPEQSKEEHDFWGVWKIDEVVLTSDMYTGTTKDGDSEENLYNPEDYIGMEVEYSSNSFRLGSQIYDEPRYIFKDVSVEDFQNGGDFRLPDLYSLIEEKQIKVEKSNKYDNLSETLLLRFDITFADDVQYDTYSFIPVGTQCVLLNNNTMLIGVWGKILLAHKVR